ETGKLVCAELIGIVLLRPIGSFLQIRSIGPEVSAARPLAPRTYAVAPVVAIGETAAGPANDGRFQTFQIIDQGFTNPAGVGDLRILSHPNAPINAAAEMLRKVPIDIRRDGSNGFIGKNIDPRGRGQSGARRKQGEAGKQE